MIYYIWYKYPLRKTEGNPKKKKKDSNLLSICLGNFLGLKEGLPRKQKEKSRKQNGNIGIKWDNLYNVFRILSSICCMFKTIPFVI